MQGGAVHAGRQAGIALCGGARCAGADGLRQHAGLSGSHGGAGVARNQPVAASQSRPDGCRRILRACARFRPAWASCWKAPPKRLMAKGMAHHGSPDKAPELRLECIAQAGIASVPFTSGILIGIGETRRERIEALLALRDLHDALWPYSGNHCAEFPRQARHPHGGRARAGSG